MISKGLILVRLSQAIGDGESMAPFSLPSYKANLCRVCVIFVLLSEISLLVFHISAISAASMKPNHGILSAVMVQI